MSIDLTRAVVYDIETYPNVFTLTACTFGREDYFTWEISHRRNNLASLLTWFNYLYSNRVPMIGYNNIGFDYPVIHWIYQNPSGATVEAIYAKAQQMLQSRDNEKFGLMIWDNQRFAPQIDLFKIWHFDNKAKSQSLKGLQFNMRSKTVEDLPVAPGTYLTNEQADQLIKYNIHDVAETDRFAQISKPAIEFRDAIATKFDLKGDVLNFNDTKIGKQLLEQRLGEDVCYVRSNFSGRKEKRQTYRHRIPLADVIFPYIKFEHPEFQRILDWMKQQTLTPADLESDENQKIATKGVFKGVHATINGFQFDFGTGGIHGSVKERRVWADDEWAIEDIDVTSLYPSIAIVNKLYPEHLGEAYIREYSNLKAERVSYKKGSPENGALKLGLNGTYGDSNNEHSVFYDPQYTMATTINGQLELCMLAEQLMMRVPTLELIQINTDGMTFKIHRSMIWLYRQICKEWEAYTLLDLEYASYKRMFIRDVNNYIAEDLKGKLKLKGDYWYPKVFPDDITNAGPPAWHKDLSAPVVQRAAEAAMLHGVDPVAFIHLHTDPFDFMLRAKVDRASQLFIGDTAVQRITRYYMAKNGGAMRKISPPTGTPGEYKLKRGVKETDAIVAQVVAEVGPGVWDKRIHQANKAKHDEREMSLQAGWKVAECNDAADFSFDNLDRAWYIEQARKLIV